MGSTRIACLRSFLHHGHEFELYTYKQFAGIPDGIKLRDANKIIPASEVSRFGKDLAPFSDLFRYALLKQEGGWWCDIDTICLTSSIPKVEEAWSLESPKLNTEEVGNGQICLKKDSPLAQELCSRSVTLSAKPLKRRESLGPLLFTETIRDLGLEKNKNANSELFYPYKWLDSFKLWLPEYRHEVESRVSDSYFLPLYQSFPAYCGLDLLKIPPKGSYLYCFLEQYSAIEENTEVYDATYVRDAIQSYLKENSTWTFRELSILCGPDIFKELNLTGPRPKLHSRIKTKIRAWGSKILHSIYGVKIKRQ